MEWQRWNKRVTKVRKRKRGPASTNWYPAQTLLQPQPLGLVESRIAMWKKSMTARIVGKGLGFFA